VVVMVQEEACEIITHISALNLRLGSHPLRRKSTKPSSAWLANLLRSVTKKITSHFIEYIAEDSEIKILTRKSSFTEVE